MKPELFLKNFRHVVNAPKGVQSIRDMVLGLAVTGRLSTTHEKDTAAEECVRRCRIHYERLVAEGRIRQELATSGAVTSDSFGLIPDTWVWSTIGEVTSYGSTEKAEFVDVSPSTWVLELEDIKKGTSKIVAKVRAGERRFKSSKNRFSPGQVLYGKLRPYLDKVVIADEPGVCTTEIVPILAFDGLEPEYLRVFLKSPRFRTFATNSTHGMNLPRLGTSAARSAPFPLPPLEEQKRIVAKVDEMMQLCDRLEAQQQEREKLLPILSRVNHTRFITKPTIKSLTGVFHQHGTVSPGDMRETVLSLAARGFLAEQNPEDDSVDELLSRIQMQREECESSDVEDVSSDEEFFAIPKSWRWVRLGNISTHSDSGWSPQCKETRRVGDEWGILKVSAVSWGRFLPEENKGLPASEIPRPGCEVRDGDFLMSRANTFELVAKSVIVEAPPPHLMLSDKIVRFHLPAEIDKSYINLFNLSPWARQYYAKNASGTSSSMKNVSRKVMSRLPIPFPPAAEQRRIVSRVRQFMSLIDRLEQQTNENRKIAASFARAAVAAITSTDFTENESMKPPKTEVVTALKVGKKPKKTDAAPLATLLSEQKADASAKTLWQLSGLEIDAFYRQLKKETANGWIEEDTSKRDIKEVEVG